MSDEEVDEQVDALGRIAETGAQLEERMIAAHMDTLSGLVEHIVEEKIEEAAEELAEWGGGWGGVRDGGYRCGEGGGGHDSQARRGTGQGEWRRSR